MSRTRMLGALGVGIGVAVAHLLVEYATWAAWDRAIRPGEVRTTPALWPIISFPAFPLYDYLSKGDRAMFGTFNWVMLGNSVIWGMVAALVFVGLARGREETHPQP